MLRALRPLTCLILLAALPGLAVAGDHAHGRGSPPPSSPQQDPEPRQDSSALPDSVRRVERSTGGEVLRAEPMQRDGREVYRIKVITTDGRIRVMQEDPGQPAPEPRRDSRKGKDKDKQASPATGQDADQTPPQE